MFRNLITGIFLAFCTASAAWAGPAVFTQLNAFAQPTAISGDGSIVAGTIGFSAGGFYWTEQTGVVLIGGNLVNSISRDGSTIVGGANDTSGVENAAYWTRDGSGWTLLGSFTPESAPCPPNLLSSGYGVNGDGSVIVGLGWDGCAYSHGFRWIAGSGMTDLGSLVSNRASRANAVSADGQTIVGWSDDPTGFRQGARWVDGAWQWFSSAEGPVSEALAVNADGSLIAGGGCGLPFTQFAWCWTEKTGANCVLAPYENPLSTDIIALSDSGRVFGGTVNIGTFELPDFRAVLWLDGEPLDFRLYLLSQGVAEVQDWDLETVTAVSADGQTVAGWGTAPDRLVHGFVVTLPST
jgi:probable HAF family extracellular repeat protein